MNSAPWAMPLLSIVTINRNNAEDLAKTLQSFAPLRANPALQFVFVDGLSSDDSLAIASRFYRPDEMSSEPDRGIYDAMNKGLRRSVGKYVLWINSGDAITGDLAALLHHFRRDAGLLAFAVEIARTDGFVEKVLAPTLERMPDGMIVHQGMAFHRETLNALGGYNESWRLTADYDAFLRLYLAGCEIVCLPHVISRFHLGGVSSDLRAVARERLEILRANRAISLRQYWYRRLRHHGDPLLAALQRLGSGAGGGS